MEKYELKEFAKWCKKERLADDVLEYVISEMERGLLEDRLGGNIFKKRIPLGGKEKRGGARTILIFTVGEYAVFLYGYPKNEKADFDPREEEGLRIFAKAFAKLSAVDRKQKVSEGVLVIIKEKES